MSNHKGFDDWISVFKAGTHTDSAGNTRTWTDDDLKTIAGKYDPQHHEAPAVIGHPKDNAPAYGWVEKLKAENGLLYAKCKEVVPAFADMVKQGLFKKRSISLYPDLRLRHIGFLGAMPPAVKGLPDMAFNADDGAVTIECSEFTSWSWEAIARIFRNLREWFIEKEGRETADRIIQDWDIEDIKDEGRKPADEPSALYHESINQNKNKEVSTMTFREKMKNFMSLMGVDVSKVPDDALPEHEPAPETGSFSEADVKEREKAAEKRGRDGAMKEFQETARKERETVRKNEITAWCEEMVAKGNMTPALVKFGVPEMLSFMAASEEIVEFGEEKAKATFYDRFKALFETELPKVIAFKEVATRDMDTGGSGEAGKKLEALTAKKMAENGALSYSEALNAVQMENPELAKEYAAEIRG